MNEDQRHALRNAADAVGDSLRAALDDCPMNWELIETWGRTLQHLATLYMMEGDE